MAEPVHRHENSEERPRTGNGPLRLILNGASLTWRDLASALKAERVEVALDPVSRGQMLRAREAACRELTSLNLDTTDTTPEQAAASVLREQDDAGDGAPAPDPRPPGAPGTPETARPDAGPSRSATA